MSDALSTHAQAQLVPAGYAEKAMASLMQLHAELMDEKERRVDLYRRLMEREQSLAELKLYVQVLEERLSGARPAAPAAAAVPPEPARVDSAAGAQRVPGSPPAPGARAGPVVKGVPTPAAPRPRPDGWKTW